MPVGGPGGFSSASKLLQKKWEDRQYKQHVQKIAAIKPLVDNGQPKKLPHLVVRLKKVQKDEEQQEKIDRENHLLLDKMTHIMRHKGSVDHWNDHYYKKGLHQHYREKEQERIHEENLGIAKRLGKVRPIYDLTDWENSYIKHEYYLDLWANATKENLMQRSSRNHNGHYYNEAYEGSRSRSKNGFLPNIHSREGAHSDRSTSQKRGSTVTKLPKIKRDKDKMVAPYDCYAEVLGAIAEQDAKLLFKASKQLVEGDQAILQSLIKRSHPQRMATKRKFEEMYDMDLETELKGGLDREYGPLVEAVLTEREDADSSEINRAVRSNDTASLTEILCTRNSTALSSIQKSYEKKYSIPLNDDIESSIKNEESRIFILALLNGQNSPKGELNEEKAEEDAQKIHNAGKGRFQKKGEFLNTVNASSLPQIKAIFAAYPEVSGGKDLPKVMQEHRANRDFVSAVDTMSNCMGNSANYHADKMHGMLKAGQTRQLTSLLLARAEIDLPEIRKAYKKKHGIDLTEDLQAKGGKEVGPLMAQIALKQPPGGAGREPVGK
ncbi:hypothetical protein CAPTEDRAFT_214127, partial [Capitella teleta]